MAERVGGARRVPRRDSSISGTQPARRWRRLFSAAAVDGHPPRHSSCQHPRQTTRHVLFPPVGAGSGAAALPDAVAPQLSSLRRSPTGGSEACGADSPLLLRKGSRRTPPSRRREGALKLNVGCGLAAVGYMTAIFLLSSTPGTFAPTSRLVLKL